MVFDTEKIKKNAKKDFEKTWIESAKLLPSGGFKAPQKKGKSHPVWEIIQKTREIFTEMGFDETENPVFIDESEVYDQYGTEAPVILDRCYYLAALPRPEIGLSAEKEKQIGEIIKWGAKEKKILTDLLRDYKKGKIEGDDFVEETTSRLGIRPEEATKILDVFPEFKQLSPQPTKTTLRSHMTGAWFPTLSSLVDSKETPVQLFSIGLRFRREQRVDSTHLRSHWGASCVVMDEKMNMEDGKKLAEKILAKYGFEKTRFETKKATSKYYAPGQEIEIYAQHEGNWYEIADMGMYSPIALANYDINIPVFNMGIGIERLIMVLYKKNDIREIVFPQFYGTKTYSDKEIASAIRLIDSPETQVGKKITQKIVEIASANKDAESPCEFKIYEDEKLLVKIVEPENNTKLCGPACLNHLWVYDGEIVALPPDKEFPGTKEIKQKGIDTKISFLSAYANMVAKQIEETGGGIRIYVRNVKSISDINLALPKNIERQIMSQNKKIMVKGPFFTTVVAEKK